MKFVWLVWLPPLILRKIMTTKEGSAHICIQSPIIAELHISSLRRD
ncbi:hypothetical protein [Helicobacter cappadocius]|uniref:Uncharacterized protein n=1 Tax=Helicobacter cappadocius TaxID=3063998 RepID=A0ABT8Z5W1_9HELI|nr:hypothetical protein [Helicobacter sp. faydin-H75]MDO7253582.1 hypothetical protein [Helicobacter sp. faydin-H75]